MARSGGGRLAARWRARWRRKEADSAPKRSRRQRACPLLWRLRDCSLVGTTAPAGRRPALGRRHPRSTRNSGSSSNMPGLSAPLAKRDPSKGEPLPCCTRSPHSASRLVPEAECPVRRAVEFQSEDDEAASAGTSSHPQGCLVKSRNAVLVATRAPPRGRCGGGFFLKSRRYIIDVMDGVMDDAWMGVMDVVGFLVKFICCKVGLATKRAKTVALHVFVLSKRKNDDPLRGLGGR